MENSNYVNPVLELVRTDETSSVFFGISGEPKLGVALGSMQSTDGSW